MQKNLKLLIIEDSDFDARIVEKILRQGGYEPISHRVDSETTLRDALGKNDWDVILSDYNLPGFTACDALRILKMSGLDIPFIIVSGDIEEYEAAAVMKSGAHDFLKKGELARLVVAVERETREAQVRRERKEVEHALKENELRYRLIWENSTDAFVFIDVEGMIHFANPAATEIFGYPESELEGARMERLFGESGLSAMRRQLTRGQGEGANGRKGRLLQIEGRTQTGKLIPLEISTSKLEWHQRQMIVAFIRDISERLRTERELRHHEEQFRAAREIQQWMFPKHSPECSGLDIAGASFPTEAAGGDYFDYLKMPRNRLGLVVADVTGHGIGPALLMAEARAYVRVLAQPSREVGEMLTQANAALAEDLSRERYITMILSCVDWREKTLSWSNAGHTDGFIVDRQGEIRVRLNRSGPPLGIRPDTRYESQSGVSLLAGDIVVILTDGFEEALSEQDEFFGEDRIRELVHRQRSRQAHEILESLRAAVERFTGDQSQADDLTGIIIRVNSSSPAE